MSRDSLREREEAKWAAIVTPGRVDFIVRVVTPAEFEAMKRWGEYSCTLPSGVYIGKRWLRDASFQTRKPPEWWMGHYVRHSESHPGEVDIEWTPILVE